MPIACAYCNLSIETLRRVKIPMVDSTEPDENMILIS
jgi:hypothetical protein